MLKRFELGRDKPSLRLDMAGTIVWPISLV
jgi:hypothetical protein